LFLARILCKRPGREKASTDSELLALVAGNALNENIAHEIEVARLAFSATDAYRSQLTAAGADAHVLTATQQSNAGQASTNGEKQSSPELLQHLSAAGKLLRSKQFDQVAQELNSASNPAMARKQALSWESFSAGKSNGP